MINLILQALKEIRRTRIQQIGLSQILILLNAAKVISPTNQQYLSLSTVLLLNFYPFTAVQLINNKAGKLLLMQFHFNDAIQVHSLICKYSILLKRTICFLTVTFFHFSIFFLVPPGAHYKEHATPIISQYNGIFTDQSILRYFSAKQASSSLHEHASVRMKQSHLK